MHRTLVFAFIVTEFLDDWEDKRVMGMFCVQSNYSNYGLMSGQVINLWPQIKSKTVKYIDQLENRFGHGLAFNYC